MGVLDLPHPLFALLDPVLAAFLPPAGRLVAWAVIGSLLTLGLYRLLSPQARIGQVKREARTARQRLYAYDGELAGAWPLISAQLGASLRHIGLVLPATMLAVLPLISLLTWLETAYGRDYPPPGTEPVVQVEPPHVRAQWLWSDGDEGPRAAPTIRAHHGETAVAEIALAAPVPVIERPRWWHWLIGNPAGYLPADGPVERIEIELPAKHYIGAGPEWARAWPAVFLPAFLLFSLLTYRVARIQ